MLSIAIVTINELTGKLIPTEYAALALAVLNIGTRILTNGPITKS
jgi:hypothetical protein